MVVLTEIADRDEFQKILNENQGIVIIKFGATWCQPCKLISPYGKRVGRKIASKYYSI